MKTMIVVLMTTLFSICQPASAADKVDSGTGEIRKIEVDARRVIIKHGDWVRGNMSAMTMAMTVRTGVKLESLKKGDQVQFEVAQEKGDWVVTQIKPVAK